jgi:hypothetical protein
MTSDSQAGLLPIRFDQGDKTVSVLCDGERWRVTRRILRKIIDV